MKLRTNLKEIAANYMQVCRIVPALIEASGRKPEEIYKSIGMSKTTYYTRIKQSDWTPDELLQIGVLLEEGTPGEQSTF